jgi:hypothetical protein
MGEDGKSEIDTGAVMFDDDCLSGERVSIVCFTKDAERNIFEGEEERVFSFSLVGLCLIRLSMPNRGVHE